jgi:preprotein translocase subunit YajC
MRVGDRVRTNGGRVGTIRELVDEDGRLVAHLDVEGEQSPRRASFDASELTPMEQASQLDRES